MTASTAFSVVARGNKRPPATVGRACRGMESTCRTRLYVSPALTINRHRAQRAGPVIRSDATPRTPDHVAMADRPAANPALIVQVMAFIWAPEDLRCCRRVTPCLPDLIRQQSLIAANTIGVRQAALPMATDRNHKLF